MIQKEKDQPEERNRLSKESKRISKAYKERVPGRDAVIKYAQYYEME